MPQRKCIKTKVNVTRACKRITLPIEWELYKQLVGDDQLFRSHLDQMIEQYPELFPAQIGQGYRWHDQRTSHKMPEVTLRRIKLNAPAVGVCYVIFVRFRVGLPDLGIFPPSP